MASLTIPPVLAEADIQVSTQSLQNTWIHSGSARSSALVTLHCAITKVNALPPVQTVMMRDALTKGYGRHMSNLSFMGSGQEGRAWKPTLTS